MTFIKKLTLVLAVLLPFTADAQMPPVSFAPFGNTPNANGAKVKANKITLEPADASNPGGITAATYNLIQSLSGSGGPKTTNVVSTNFVMPVTLSKDYILNVNTSGGAVSITLPDAVSSDGFCINMKNIGANTVNISAPSLQTIDALSSDSLTLLNESHKHCAIGGNWSIY